MKAMKRKAKMRPRWIVPMAFGLSGVCTALSCSVDHDGQADLGGEASSPGTMQDGATGIDRVDASEDGNLASSVDAASEGAAPKDYIGPSSTAFVPSGPITLISGQTVSGVHVTSTSGPCIVGSNVQNVRITNSKIGPCGPTAQGVGVSLYASHDVRVDHNAFDDIASALYAQTDTSGRIVFDHNVATRIRGPKARGQLVQFNGIAGPGHRIACNVSDQTLPGYLAGPEDHISIFKSAGTAESPIEIAYNRMRGGGPSLSGSGILAGDYGSAHVSIHHNTMVETANVGFAIAGGSDIRYEQNRAFSGQTPYSNVGAYVWAQADAGCKDNAMIGNRTYWYNKTGTWNPFWNGGNCENTTLTNNVWGDTTLSAKIFDEPYTECE